MLKSAASSRHATYALISLSKRPYTLRRKITSPQDRSLFLHRSSEHQRNECLPKRGVAVSRARPLLCTVHSWTCVEDDIRESGGGGGEATRATLVPYVCQCRVPLTLPNGRRCTTPRNQLRCQKPPLFLAKFNEYSRQNGPPVTHKYIHTLVSFAYGVKRLLVPAQVEPSKMDGWKSCGICGSMIWKY
jgi:hypothetical protein